jgi:hypothetical protein
MLKHASTPTADPVRAILIGPDGTLEVVHVYPDPAWISDLVEAGRWDAVIPRATWPVKGDVITLWSRTDYDEHAANELAGRVLDELLPPTPPGVEDRVRDVLELAPICGKAVITGYRPRTEEAPGATVAVSDVTLELIRSALDGRKARRYGTAVDTEALTIPVPPTTAMPVVDGDDPPPAALDDVIKGGPGPNADSNVGTLARLMLNGEA